MLAGEVRNLLADAESTRSYYMAETMGRSAGWLAYGAAIAGEASLVISVEDITGKFEGTEENHRSERPAKPRSAASWTSDEVVKRIVATMRVREETKARSSALSSSPRGSPSSSPRTHIEGVPRDEHGHIAVAQLNLGRLFADMVSTEYARQTGKKRRVSGVQLGYECRCAQPQAFDVMLGSQLGVGAYRALVEERLDGVMVSAAGQLELQYVPFEQLVDPTTLVTKVRYIEPDSDFHRLARFLETYVG